jgi:glutathione peroxidase
MFFFLAKEKKVNSNIPNSIYDISVSAIDGGTINFSEFKGKKILIVNTASKCGFTPQFEQLEALYRIYKDKLIIVGFPSNDFLFQDPGSNEEIAAFCKKNYGVTFPMAAKIKVKGKDKAAIYNWLTNKSFNQVMNSKVSWNFQKYLINEKGELVEMFSPNTKPNDPVLIKAIEQTY